jgi:hypothetical protein
MSNDGNVGYVLAPEFVTCHRDQLLIPQHADHVIGPKCASAMIPLFGQARVE